MEWKPISGVRVVGVGYKARQGKDTIANYLAKQFNAQKFSFSDALYDVARVVFGMEEKDGPLLQVLGTEVFRRRDPDVWVKTVYRKIQDKAPAIAVIPDVRFPNEAQMVKDMGGKLIQIQRYLADGERYVASDRPATHPSEVSMDGYKDWDAIIQSKDGDFAGIYAAVDAIMRG